jgi:hypothetical protein
VGQDFGETINVNEAINDIFGEYSLIGTATATCSCAGQFGGGGGSTVNVQPPVINQSGVVIYDQSGNIVTSVEIGMTGSLAIYGTGLAAGGYDLSPVVAVTNGVVITGLTYVSDEQVNVNYSATSATAGTASLTLTTYVATSSPASVPVGDLTPVIKGIGPTSSFVAQVPVYNLVISGQHLGTVCPTFQIPFTYTFTGESCTDTAVTFASFTATSAGSGNLTLTAEGYGDGFAPQTKGESQTASTAVSAVQPAIKLTLVGPITISTDGLYSENAVIQLQAVRSDTGASVAFPFPVYLMENGTSIYSQNGGTLPGQAPNPVALSASGSAQVTAKSLAGPATSSTAPGPAQIQSSNFQTYGGSLQIPQWITSGTVIDPRASGMVYDWFQSMSKNLAPASGNPVLATLTSYTLSAAPCNDAGAGACTPQSHSATSSSQINPFSTSMRVNSPAQTYPTTCGVYRGHEFADTLYHESRHAYQFSLTVNILNDLDQDYLVESIPIAPTTIFLDTTTSRQVCTPPSTFMESYSGDSIKDPWNLVLNALECRGQVRSS